jgi:hypothetical protein
MPGGQEASVKLGIPLLVIGVLLLVLSLPLSIMLLFGGVNRLVVGDISGGVLAYAGLAAVILGMVLTTIGAFRVFKD